MTDPRPPITPLNPSRSATARVTNPLPTPTTCRFCGGAVHLVQNDAIYGRRFGEWPWAYLCTSCRAYVGLHPFTAIPLGTLATAAIRKARSEAKDAFNPLWLSGHMTRREAYAWLAGALGIANIDECHIGWFDVEQCQAVIEAVRRRPARTVLGQAIQKAQAWPDKRKHRADSRNHGTTGPAHVADCGCDVLPWDHCSHTMPKATERTT